MRCPSCGNDEQVEGTVNCTNCGLRLTKLAEGGMDVVGEACAGCGLLLPGDFTDACPRCGFVRSEGETQTNARAGWPGGAPVTAAEGALSALLTFGAAFALSTVFFVLVAQLARPGGFAQMMLNPGGGLNAVPWAIQLLFFWLLAILFVRRQSLRGERQWLSGGAIRQVSHFLETGGGQTALSHLARSPSQSTVVARLRRLIQHSQTAEGTQHIQETVRFLGDSDRDRVASGYTLARLFIWCMPVLGFIGTVIGISIAVGKFSGFLGGEITNTDVIVQQLGEVTQGLSYAFYSTLHGLVASLLAMIPTTWLQKGEEDFVADLDQVCMDEIAPRVEGGGTARHQ